MAYVITEHCNGVKDRTCVEVCPCDCIHAGIVTVEGQTYDQLFIHPEECIDCGLCEAACPVDAIFEETDVPAVWTKYIKLNADFYRQNGR